MRSTRRCTPRCWSAWSPSPGSGGWTRASRRRPRSPRTWSTSPGTVCPAWRPAPACWPTSARPSRAVRPGPPEWTLGHQTRRTAGVSASSWSGGAGLEQLEAVAVGIGDVAASVAGEVVVPGDLDAVLGKAGDHGVEVVGEQAGVRLAGRAEVGLDAEVQLERG